MFKLMVHRKWLLATVLVLAAMMVMVRLGIWQLDRLEKRQAFNARVSAQLTQPELDLTAVPLPEGLSQMEYRAVRVTGEYNHSEEIALRNQYWQDQWGVHLVTPLIITGSEQSVLIDRGWIPGDVYQGGDWSQYNEPGPIMVKGIIRQSQEKAELGSRTDPTPEAGSQAVRSWNFINIPAISSQVSEELLPVYIQQAPEPGWEGPPVRTQPELELTEGPHLSYALQWFTFAALLGIGYPFYIKRQTAGNREKV